MNKLFDKIELANGVLVELFTQGNRYFGDYHRLQINVIVTIPLDIDSLPTDLKNAGGKRTNYITYERTLERMGVATNQVDSVTKSMIDDFIKTTGCYLEKKEFAEYLLRKSLILQPLRNRFSL
jgi:hypothetical protein